MPRSLLPDACGAIGANTKPQKQTQNLTNRLFREVLCIVLRAREPVASSWIIHKHIDKCLCVRAFIEGSQNLFVASALLPLRPQHFGETAPLLWRQPLHHRGERVEVRVARFRFFGATVGATGIE